ncbi:hypothetical protein E2C01_046776 [Portunus trituberculatus]|uniref:Uncharacterized protein n=1 Tax=Portunus trituberculatus TaxID=210409 RepID=A0A5B7G607_PORTR|nr:hypothetical protein [Portunus trituberculatus]
MALAGRCERRWAAVSLAVLVNHRRALSVLRDLSLGHGRSHCVPLAPGNPKDMEGGRGMPEVEVCLVRLYGKGECGCGEAAGVEGGGVRCM